jgi:hypothetical protein
LIKTSIGLLAMDICFLNGDFVDRGENVTQVLWLIYKIENQAQKQGGKLTLYFRQPRNNEFPR